MSRRVPWGQRHIVSKIALLAFLAVAFLLLTHWLRLAMLVPTEPATDITPAAEPPEAVHTHPSADALFSATHYIATIEQTMLEGLTIIEANQVPQLVAHSQVFKSLIDYGHAQFGHSVFEPLGKCGAAGLFANSWWQARVSAARQGVTAEVATSINNHWAEYKNNRTECLQQADPTEIVATFDEVVQTAPKAH
ncbi:hypothetical protein ACM1ZW_20890 [Pseudomonas sp. NFX71]|uniref:hypothetical protein n=1 Tax=Pseudomonas sp. NFX71 TaxID=3399121 RepID=UPI003A8C2ED2